MPCLFCGNIEAPGTFKPHRPCQLLVGSPCAPCKEIQELESELAQAKDAVHRMLVRHRELRTKMNHSHDCIIQQLPTEIVSHIFELSLPERPLEQSSRGLTKHEIRAPLILGSVCQVWRQIAFSTPQIWTSISIHLGYRLGFAKAWPALYELAQEWLSRSGDLPLWVYIYGSQKTSGHDVGPLIEIVNRYSSRWKHLELELPRQLVPLLCGDSSGISILQSLRLHGEDQFGFHNLDDGFFSLGNVKPSPTFVSLGDWPLKSVGIEWSHATHVNLEWADISKGIEVLRRAPQLICFKFVDNKNRLDISPYANPITPIIRPLLRELHVGATDTEQAANFCDSFIFLGLEILTFSYCWTGPLIPTNNLISLLKRSSCHLTTLSVEKASITIAEIVPLLQSIPSVCDLKFYDLLCDAFVNVLETLTSTSGDMTGDCYVLPVLESLSLNGEHSTKEPFPWSLVSKLFGPLSDIHNPHRRPLRQFNISFNLREQIDPFLYIEDEFIHRFLEFREAGIALDFRILYRRCIPVIRKLYIEERDLLELSIEHRNQINKPGTSS